MKKILVSSLSFLLVFPFTAHAFYDSVGHLNEEAISYFEDNGVVLGYGGDMYLPDNQINRAEFLKIILESLDTELDAPGFCFPDVQSDWYAQYVCKAKSLGIVSGYLDGYFRPADKINLAEALKIILEAYDTPLNFSSSVWYEPYFSFMQGNDLLHFVNMDIGHYLTRGEMAQLIYNLEDYYGRIDGNPETPDGTEEVAIAGRVTDNFGNPVKGASVTAAHVLEQSGKIYRYEGPTTVTDNTGNFLITEDELASAIEPRIGALPTPYNLFVTVQKEGYLDQYIYDYGETPKKISSGTWQISTVLEPLPAERQTKMLGEFSAHYYPGGEDCADIALQKMNKYYAEIKAFMGLDFPDSVKKEIIFNTKLQQGYGDWTGGVSIQTVCYPWTDNIESSQIEDMWNSAIPHEMGHQLVSDLWAIPYWSDEGFAQYISHKVNNQAFMCNTADYLPVQDLTGENIPYYETAACFWNTLDENFPGFTSATIQYISQSSAQLSQDNKTSIFIDQILVPVLGDKYGYSETAASDFLQNFMKNFHYESDKA